MVEQNGAQARGHFEVLTLKRYHTQFNGLAQFHTDQGCDQPIHPGKNHSEFLTSVARDEINLTHTPWQTTGHDFQNGIARSVPVAVVEPVEVVHIEHDQANGSCVSHRFLSVDGSLITPKIPSR